MRSGRGCPPSQYLGTRWEASDLPIELRVICRRTGRLASTGAGTTRACESGLCTFSLLLSLLLEACLFLVGLFHGLEAVSRILSEVLGLFHVRHGLVVLPNLRSLVLPHLRDELGDVGLSASGLTGSLRLLEDLHLCRTVEYPCVGRTRRSTI